MKLFKNQKSLDFEQPNWEIDPELFLIHQILETRSDIVRLAAACFPKAKTETQQVIGRDGMTVEQIVRSAIYQRHTRSTYAELSKATADSKLCRAFLYMQNTKRYSAQTLQENIAKISLDVIEKMNLMINIYAMKLGVDDGKKLFQDSTVINSNIHFPTNASLAWDCIRVACCLQKRTQNLLKEIPCRNYQKGSKKLTFKIVNTSGPNAKERRKPLFKKLVKNLHSCENQLVKALDILNTYVLADSKKEKLREKYVAQLTALLPKMQLVENLITRYDIKGEIVPVDEKIFSIFECHTDCIRKGNRKALFGHKINITAGKSHLIFDCFLERGNPSDSKLYTKALDHLENNLQLTPETMVADGGYASIKNIEFALSKNIKQIVFNKIKGAMKNITSSANMETMLKKWRAGIEALISNFKRGLNAATCTWKGWDAFQRFIMWNVLTFNLRIIAKFLIKKLV